MMKKLLKYSIITAVWLAIWHLIAIAVSKELLLPSPVSVAIRLIELMQTSEFYKTIAYSVLRILVGMLVGIILGAIGGVLTAHSSTAKDFFAPPLAVIRSTPVASFIILLVLWISRDLTPLIIALMMVTPIVWTGVEAGILNTDKDLIEMARAYKMSPAARLRHVYLPSIAPYFLASLKSSLGIAWKAGIAAEVLLEPIISIGKMISDAKSYIETTDLFAWTAVVVILSVVIEKITVLALQKALKNHPLHKKGGATLD